MIKKLALGIVSSLALIGVSAFATTPGSDNANNSAYSGGWTNGTDGGSPTFGGWTLSPNPNNATAGFFIGDSTLLDAPGGNINTNSKAFGVFGHDTGGNADATRAFDSPLTAGETFSLDLAVNFRNGNKGFDLLSGTSSIFNLNIGGDTYTVNNAATGNGSLFGAAYSSNTVFHLSMTQTTLSGGSWTITRSGGLTGTASGTYTGDGSGFHLYNSMTTGGGANEDNLFANNLAVVPEPSTVALLAGPALLGAWFFIRRRRAS